MKSIPAIDKGLDGPLPVSSWTNYGNVYLETSWSGCCCCCWCKNAVSQIVPLTSSCSCPWYQYLSSGWQLSYCWCNKRDLSNSFPFLFTYLTIAWIFILRIAWVTEIFAKVLLALHVLDHGICSWAAAILHLTLSCSGWTAELLDPSACNYTKYRRHCIPSPIC